VVSVAAPGDVVVPAANSWWRGATNTIAGDLHDVGLGAHGELPGQPEVLRELTLALAGLPARCLSFARAVGAALVGSSIGAAEAALVAVGLAWLP
jgi:hypothetical protein